MLFHLSNPVDLLPSIDRVGVNRRMVLEILIDLGYMVTFKVGCIIRASVSHVLES